MTFAASLSISNKARAGRRAALAAMNARRHAGGNVVSIYGGGESPRFQSVRESTRSVLILTAQMAA